MKFWMTILCMMSLSAHSAAGQTMPRPIQDERPNPIECLIALEGLSTSFRTHLNRQCFAVPLKLCEVRGTPKQCLSDTSHAVRDFVIQGRLLLPSSVEGSVFAQRRYSIGLRRLDAFIGACPQAAACPYEMGVQPALELFRLARQVNVTLKRTP